MKKILGLDLGTNSIGWALIQHDFQNKGGEILGMGSRIIPMSQDILGDFGKGNSVSQTAERTGYRGIRRLRERYLLRRERLHRVLNVLDFLPEHFKCHIDFENRLGKFFGDAEPKLAYNEKEFIFKKSFLEMLEDFRKHQPQLLVNEKGEEKLVPYDWTIYYLRKKALTKKIEREELAWILLNFNQKRGYYQLRGVEEEFAEDNSTEVRSLKVLNIIKGEKDKKYNKIWYTIELEGGYTFQSAFYGNIDGWIRTTRDFVITKELLKDGTTKFKISSLPTLDEIDKLDKKAQNKLYGKIKIKTENEIDKSNKTVGVYIYDTLLQNPKQKINGKLVRTIERKFYKDELTQILKAQKDFHQELQNENLYNDCVRELYRNNDTHQITLSEKDFIHLFLEDIIFYQRPLKSKKSSISNCTFEYRKYKATDGNEKIEPLKAIPKSHPLYQEFRLWQWMYNLGICKRDDDTNVTSEFLNSIETYEQLFYFLYNRKEIDQKALLKYFKLNEKNYRWNFVEDKKYPCNETRTQITTRLSKVESVPNDFITSEVEGQLWHIIYSVTDKTDYEKALKTFAEKHQLDKDSFVENFKKFPPFKSEYGSYSEKAIKKFLPLMRLGKYWNLDAIDYKTKERIDKILTGEYDVNIKDRVREKSINLSRQEHFQGLQLWLASYIVYDRHSEASMAEKWNSINDLKKYLDNFKQHSLRNPIVEQVITETIRVVKDIWEQYGKGAKDFFDEIHIELGREMKNTKDERERLSKINSENENTNLRIKALLVEMLQLNEVENVRPYSPSQQEILKIYEDGVLNSNIEIPEDILKISKTAQPSNSELLRYKLWLEQKYRSPYTGLIIPLNKLFTPDYEIEHIIPQSRYFDDSFSNKVICEAALNKLKDNQIGLEFIKNHHGEIVETGFGKSVKVFEVGDYENFVKENYAKNRSKRNKLLLEDIPEKMVERQMNDTRYISKFITSILSNIVRGEINDDGVNSKNVVPGNGKITSILKQDWGLNDVWNELILPRFERMNQIANSKAFTTYNGNHQKYLPTVPLEFSKGFQKKRIDHRHHGLDALIIACASRSHVNYLNNQNALEKNKNKQEKQKSREDLKRILCDKTKPDANGNYQWIFKKPWSNFTVDAQNHLETTIVSFKQNLRVINKTNNKYEKWVEKDGKKSKEFVNQTKGDSWSIRRSMHQETVAGLIKLQKQKEVSLNNAIDDPNNIVDKSLRRKILGLQTEGNDKKKINKYFKDIQNKWEQKDITKVKLYYWEIDEDGNGVNAASRVSLDTTFNESKIESITDTGIQKILLNHLNNYLGQKDEKGKEIAAELLAFSPEGIEEMNKNIIALNNGKFHQPILKVRTYESKGNKFNVGQTGNKKDKFVIAAKGTNLFFAIYQDGKGKRNYETIPLNEVIEHQKWRASLSKEEQKNTSLIPVKSEKGKFLFSLSPNDLVYVPNEEDEMNHSTIDFNNLSKEQTERIYKVEKTSGAECYFVRSDIAYLIKQYDAKSKIGELESQNKLQTTMCNRRIKIVDYCWKLDVDRLGNIKKSIK